MPQHPRCACCDIVPRSNLPVPALKAKVFRVVTIDYMNTETRWPAEQPDCLAHVARSATSIRASEALVGWHNGALVFALGFSLAMSLLLMSAR